MDSFLRHHLKLALPILGGGILLFGGIALYLSLPAGRVGDGIDVVFAYADMSPGIFSWFATTQTVFLVLALTVTSAMVADAGRQISIVTGGASDMMRLGKLMLMRLWGLLRFAPRHAWGTVRDAGSGKPISLAQVCIRDARGLCLAHTISDMSGRYGFLPPLQALVGQGGIATLTVKKSGYYFPAKHRKGHTDHYFGGSLTAFEKPDTHTLDIVLDRAPGARRRITGFSWLGHLGHIALVTGVFIIPITYVLIPSLATGVLAGVFCCSAFLRASLKH